MYSKLLVNPNFLKIWIAQLISQLAANLLNFALIIRVFDLAQGTKYANISVSLLVLAFGIPSVIFALLAGAYVDRMDRKKVLVVTNIARAILVFNFLFFNDNLILIYGLVFAISIFSQFFIPAEAAALPRLVTKKDLSAGNSLFLFTLYGSFAVGYSLAGPVISLWGQNSVYWITGLAFVLATLLCMNLPALKVKKSNINFRSINREVLLTVGNTSRKIISTPRLVFPIMNLTIVQMMIGVIAVIAPALALILFSQNLAQASGRIIIPAATGLLIGALFVGQVFKKTDKILMIDIGVAMSVVALISTYFIPQFKYLVFYDFIISVMTFTIGFGAAMVSVSAQTLLQINSTDEERGKIFGTLNMMMNIAASIPVLLAGIIADILNPISVLAISGGVIGIYGVYQFLTIRKHEKLYRRSS